MTLYQDGKEQKFTITIEEIIREICTSQMLEDGILYLRIEEFDKVTHEQMMREYGKYQESDIKRIILDLRNNPGGDLEAVLDVCSELLPDSMVTYTEDREGNRVEYSTRLEQHMKQPLCVLVNKGTASAAELLSGAVKDYQRGTLIGETTYGKGVVQEIRPLPNGGAFKQTVMKYFTPKGNNIDGTGVQPDITVAEDNMNLSLTEQPDVLKAIEILKQKN